MSPGIIGKKIGMTQVFRPDGQVVPVTVLKAGPCVVVQRKTPASDGYDAVQLGLLEYARNRVSTSRMAGHLKKSNAEGVKFLREFRLGDGRRRLEAGRPGSGRPIQAERKSGRGGHQQGPRVRGHREAPSFPWRATTPTVRCSTALRARSARPAFLRGFFPACAWPGTWATDRVTVRNLEIVEVDAEDNVMLVKGAVPGPNGGYVYRPEGEKVTHAERRRR